MVSCGSDGAIHLYSFATGLPVLQANPSAVHPGIEWLAVDGNADFSLFWAAGSDNRVHVWPPPSPHSYLPKCFCWVPGMTSAEYVCCQRNGTQIVCRCATQSRSHTPSGRAATSFISSFRLSLSLATFSPPRPPPTLSLLHTQQFSEDLRPGPTTAEFDCAIGCVMVAPTERALLVGLESGAVRCYRPAPAPILLHCPLPFFLLEPDARGGSEARMKR